MSSCSNVICSSFIIALKICSTFMPLLNFQRRTEDFSRGEEGTNALGPFLKKPCTVEDVCIHVVHTFAIIFRSNREIFCVRQDLTLAVH